MSFSSAKLFCRSAQFWLYGKFESDLGRPARGGRLSSIRTNEVHFLMASTHHRSSWNRSRLCGRRAESDSTQFLDGTQSVIHAGTATTSFSLLRSIRQSRAQRRLHHLRRLRRRCDLRRLGQRDGARGSGSDSLRPLGQRHARWWQRRDVLETNSTGTNTLAGAGRRRAHCQSPGTNALLGGSGNDLFVFKESASIVKSDGSFNFGQQVISGAAATTR